MRGRVAVAVLIVTALGSRAAADPVTHLKTPSSVTTDGGSSLRLPPGYFLDEPTWQDRDAKLKAAENDRTRLKAENDSLRKSAQGISFGWYALGTAVVLGFAAGAYVTK